jgi:hypothetical protein
MTTLLPLTVAVVLNGAIVPSFAPAELDAGRVVAPLETIVAALSTSASYAPGARAIELVRDGRRFEAGVVRVRDGTPYVLLAPLVRELGGSVQFDTKTKTIAIALPRDRTLRTPAPFDPRAPQVSPAALFTPEPPRPTPRAVATGVPQPRRTAIPAVPSWPLQAPGGEAGQPLGNDR